MKNLLFALTIVGAVMLTAGCVSHTIVDKSPPTIASARPTPPIPAPAMSPDVNFKASNTMPGQPPL
jgi:hypothetical protein